MGLLITQAEADRRLRATGWSSDTRRIAIKRLPKHLDGLREKVRSRDIQNLINEVEEMYERANTAAMRPVADWQRERYVRN